MIQLTQKQIKECIEFDKYQESREQYCLRKTEEGYSIFTPSDNELCLDIDTDEAFILFMDRIKRVEDEFEEEIPFTVYNSTTRGHKHIIVKLPKTIESNYERIAIQAILGSDPVREMLSLFRCWRDDPFPSLLAMKEKP